MTEVNGINPQQRAAIIAQLAAAKNADAKELAKYDDAALLQFAKDNGVELTGLQVEAQAPQEGDELRREGEKYRAQQDQDFINKAKEKAVAEQDLLIAQREYNIAREEYNQAHEKKVSVTDTTGQQYGSQIVEEPAEDLNVNDFGEEKAYVEYITQCINDMCATCVPCKFYDLIDNSDMSSIRVINDARNIALNDRDKLIDLMDYYVKYICEGTVMFENGVVKGYDYLSPLAKYAVLVSGQTLLPLCPDYNYSTMNGVYTYESLFDEFDSRINEVYSEMLTKGRTI